MEKILDDVYIRVYLLSIVGWILNLLKNLNSARRDSIMGNLEFSYGKYFFMEKIVLAINATCQIMVILYTPDIILATGKDWIATLFIGVCAFFGSEFITEIFGTARKLIRSKLDEKTTIADTHTNSNEPTPLK